MGDTQVQSSGVTMWKRLLAIPLLAVFMLFLSAAPSTAATQTTTFEELFGEETATEPVPEEDPEEQASFEELFGTPEPVPPEEAEPVAPASEPAAEQAPAPVEEERSTIVLPEFENGGTILIWIAILAVVIIGILVGWRIVVGNKHKAAELRAQRQALQADKEAALKEWKKHTDKHQELKNKVWKAETDWDILFFYPAINDPMVPETQELRFAMDKLETVSPEPPAELSLSMDMNEMSYPKAVLEAQRKWDTAWHKARVMKQSRLSKEERKTIDKIMDLLSMARDGASSDNEKQLAYQRIDALIDNLTTIAVPERAKELLEREHRQALEASVMDSINLQDMMVPEAEKLR